MDFFPDNDYFQNVVIPTIFTRSNQIKQLPLPMLDKDFFGKKDSVPPFLNGLLWPNWEHTPNDGNSVFLEDYSERGVSSKGDKAENLAKRVYFSAMTPELYPQYSQKVENFFNALLDINNAGKPLMAEYVASYWNLYWDLHLGIKENCTKSVDKDVNSGNEPDQNCIPQEIKEIGDSFIACLAEADVFSNEFKQNYNKVRELQNFLTDWVSTAVTAMDERIQDDNNEDAETFVYYWLRNREDTEFENQDVTFECYHNFVALSQWGHTIYRIMEALIDDDEVKKQFDNLKKMDNCDQGDGNSFTPLERFIMEIFRTRSPNAGSFSSQSVSTSASLKVPTGAILTTHSHKDISKDEIHWNDPNIFNPDRYKNVLTSDQIDATLCDNEKGILKKCPFPKQNFETSEGTTITNNGFGTVYSQEHPLCDTAGYAPFGFGYRRCPGEQFTIEVIKQFLKTVCDNKICFYRSDEGDREEIPIAPGTTVVDNICFDTLLSGNCDNP
ncbi:MAG: hypothetical protein QM504_16490 [Pseudomonadota bacterium]